MSQLPLEDAPGASDAAHEAARGGVVYITEHGQRLAAIVPPEYARALEGITPEEAEELLDELADAADARAGRAAIAAGEPLIPWEQVKAEAGL